MEEKQVPLTQEEIEFIKSFLLARKIYKPYGEKWGYSFWQPIMENLLNLIPFILIYLLKKIL